MKLIKFLFAIVALFSLQSCAKFKGTDISVFAEGGWMVPALTGAGAIIFIILMILEHKSGSWKIINGKVTKQDGGIIPFWKVPYFFFAAGLTLATIGIIIAFNLSK